MVAEGMGTHEVDASGLCHPQERTALLLSDQDHCVEPMWSMPRA